MVSEQTRVRAIKARLLYMSNYGIIKCHSTFGQPSGITVELANEDAKKYSEDTDKTTHFVYNYTICSQVCLSFIKYKSWVPEKCKPWPEC